MTKEELASARVVKELAKQAKFYDDGIGLLQSDRDYWKARAEAAEKKVEALEKAIRTGGICHLCKFAFNRPEEKPCHLCIESFNEMYDHPYWQLDETRFAGG